MTNFKPTNPKDLVGVAKVPFGVLPQGVVGEAALALFEGYMKYGGHNWRSEGVLASVYFNAVWRHLAAWYEGQDDDPDSGLSHLTKAIAGLMVLRDAMRSGHFKDDRPVSTEPDGWIAELNARAADIFDRYGRIPAPAHLQINTKETGEEHGSGI